MDTNLKLSWCVEEEKNYKNERMKEKIIRDSIEIGNQRKAVLVIEDEEAT